MLQRCVRRNACFIVAFVLIVDQRALSNQPWKEYTTPEGKKYWYNTENRISSWEMPEPYKAALAQAQDTPKAAAQ